MKRFTETGKWDDPWFRELPGAHKLVFLYVIDRCNNAGFWEVDKPALMWHTKLSEKHIEGAFEGLARGLQGASGWVWVKRFLRHQKNEELNPENPSHKQIITLLKEQAERFEAVSEFQSFLAPYKGLLSPIGIGKGKVRGEKGESAERGKQAESKHPSREEARSYGIEIKMDTEAVDGWFDHFEANGWRVGGKTPMRDWKAALRNGKRNAPMFTAKTSGNGSHPPKSKPIPASSDY